MVAPTNIQGRLVYSGPPDAIDVIHTAVGTSLDILHVEPDAQAVAEALQGAAAFLDASMKVRIDAEMIAGASHLQVIATATTGADHIDQHALARRGIPLLTLKGQSEVLRNLTPAAEHSWLLVMACARQLRGAVDHVLHGRWNRTDFPGVMLKGKTLGLIGCGRIGGWMARYGEAFGMRVIGFDPMLMDWPPIITPVDMPTLLKEADVISLHVHLSDDTKGLLDRSFFEQIKPGSIFVNTSRGELIDEHALLDQLRSGRIKAAGVDVVTGEPDITDSALWKYARDHTNLIITPHIGGFSPDAVRVVVEFAAKRILDHLQRHT